MPQSKTLRFDSDQPHLLTTETIDNDKISIVYCFTFQHTHIKKLEQMTSKISEIFTIGCSLCFRASVTLKFKGKDAADPGSDAPPTLLKSIQNQT
jgi:hypothetical protein